MYLSNTQLAKLCNKILSKYRQKCAVDWTFERFAEAAASKFFIFYESFQDSVLWWNNQRTLTTGASITHCTADLLFDCFGVDQTSKAVANSTKARQLNPKKINRRSAVQWYFPNNPTSPTFDVQVYLWPILQIPKSREHQSCHSPFFGILWQCNSKTVPQVDELTHGALK